MPVDAVLFDLDDTLCRYCRSGEELLEAAHERTGLDPFVTLEEYHARYPEFVDDSDSMVDLRERCFAAVAEVRGRDPADARRLARAYAAERDHGNVEPLPGLEAALSALDGTAAGVVTNGAPEMQARKVEALGLEGRFDVVVHAGYDAAAKPDPEPFEVALSALDARPARTLHVGNSLSTDVAGAQAAGVRSVWIPETDTADDTGLDADLDPGLDPEPHHVLSSLAELPALVDSRRSAAGDPPR